MTPSGDETSTGPIGRADVVFRPLADEWVLFDPAAHRLHVLNLTAALVWTHCDGTLDVEGLAAEVGNAFDDPPPPEQILREVEGALRRFRAEGLLR